jgi:hypothetical protein
MSWADDARQIVKADAATKRAFVERAIHMDTTGIDDSDIENARREIAAGYRMGTVALNLEDTKLRTQPTY